LAIIAMGGRRRNRKVGESCKRGSGRIRKGLVGQRTDLGKIAKTNL